MQHKQSKQHTAQQQQQQVAPDCSRNLVGLLLGVLGGGVRCFYFYFCAPMNMCVVSVARDSEAAKNEFFYCCYCLLVVFVLRSRTDISASGVDDQMRSDGAALTATKNCHTHSPCYANKPKANRQ
ncbi:hypothetical protein niasHT_033013 [Heterodera trifolii]|uniref:Uncharacterized protein n=1 Tax=Heterodera trifolii TaxID=157864 RepID=A0ABD2IEV0_9BILA